MTVSMHIHIHGAPYTIRRARNSRNMMASKLYGAAIMGIKHAFKKI